MVILSKNRTYLRKPQKFRILYSGICRQYPEVVRAIDHRHEVYNQNLQEVFALEKAGKVFVFVPSETVSMNTYSMKENSARELYDLGVRDFEAAAQAMQTFLEN